MLTSLLYVRALIRTRGHAGGAGGDADLGDRAAHVAGGAGVLVGLAGGEEGRRERGKEGRRRRLVPAPKRTFTRSSTHTPQHNHNTPLLFFFFFFSHLAGGRGGGEAVLRVRAAVPIPCREGVCRVYIGRIWGVFGAFRGVLGVYMVYMHV